MTTPKSHRPWRDRLRDTVDRVDTWINGPDDQYDAADAFFPSLTGTDDPAGIVFTADGTMTIPMPKVSPNVDHTPPPPIITHPECATLTDHWAQAQAEADATVAWADNWHQRQQVFADAVYVDWTDAQNRLDAKVHNYRVEAARITGGTP